jgi:hypothetical protein
MAKQKDTTFSVVLEGIELPSDVRKNIELEIRKVVLQNLATIDTKGDLVVSALGSKLRAFGGGTIGIAVRKP